jgi:mannose-6-phosphate isomerase-like protein (cupin superfamily)
MDELDKGLNISISKTKAAPILRSFQKQMDEWGIALPDIEPLVLDFGLGEFEKTGLIEYWIANEVESGYCGKYLFVFDQQTCPLHHHRNKLETFFIVKGRVKINYDERVFFMDPGDVLRVETQKAHSFTGIGSALLLEISKPCLISDNYFTDTRIPIGGNFSPDFQSGQGA